MRYIDADELLKKLPDDLPYKGSVRRVLMQAPGVDAVEVVRCKDCKWYGDELSGGKHSCENFQLPYCLENDFCSYGERRETDGSR